MKRRSTVATVDEEILKIRKKAGNPGTHCPTCGRTDSTPYRRVVNGKLAEGCIDAFHGPDLERGGISSSRDWHMRPSAVQLRRGQLATLKSLRLGK